ncbi:hypothetical protein M3Y98_00446500 [Aphelenchoides besseyi]|nr:hypothetical protein M3Y98_00446500 [Aphelenchoides besseyi]KAI6202596.1 hypothetical protein M3Y96_00965500 [Aphelenchoides besseyi]
MIFRWSLSVFCLHLLLITNVDFVVSENQENEFCLQTHECIRQVRKLIAQSNRFWFGDIWRLNCGGFAAARIREQDAIKCLNPRELTPFHSLGQRLFQARTFTTEFLQNLSIFPRMTFALQPGEYRACDHQHVIVCNQSHVKAHPEMKPLDPFLSRNVPEVSWPELDISESYVLLMVDAGFGALKYLVVDFPRAPRVIRPYETIDNFRQNQPTPLVLIVFRGNEASTTSISAASSQISGERIFDLTSFMMQHQLEDALIGINWAMIGADAYAMERQRLRGSVDNCHSLVRKKLQREVLFEFAETFPLSEMDSSLSVSFHFPSTHFEVCCKRVDVSEGNVFVDPLSDLQISSSAVRNVPTITSLRSIEYETENYQRSLRHYIAMKEDRYTLIMFDPNRQYLHWMLTDIPSGALVAGTLMSESNQIAAYLAPVPSNPGQCFTAVLMLFRQPRSQYASEITQFYNDEHVFRSKHCVGHCMHRNGFDVAQFKSFHRLRLSAISWFRVCYDAHEAARRITHLKYMNASKAKVPPHLHSPWQSKPVKKSRTAKNRRQEALVGESLSDEIQEICSVINTDKLMLNCDLIPSIAQRNSFLTLTGCFLLTMLITHFIR